MKMSLQLHAQITDLPEGATRIRNHPATAELKHVVSISLSEFLTLFIDSAADADELAEWATAAKHYLTQETP